MKRKLKSVLTDDLEHCYITGKYYGYREKFFEVFVKLYF